MIVRKPAFSLGVAMASLTLACAAPFHLRVSWLIMINVAVSKVFLLPMALAERLGLPTSSFADWAFTFGTHIRGGLWFMNEDAVLLLLGLPALLLVIGSLGMAPPTTVSRITSRCSARTPAPPDRG